MSDITLSASATSTSIRCEIVGSLELDLVGPTNDHAFAHELLPESPRRWYLTGFLVPSNAPEKIRQDPQADDSVDSGDDGGLDDGTPPDSGAAKHSRLPSSMGLSVLIPQNADKLDVTVNWGDYKSVTVNEKGESDLMDESKEDDSFSDAEVPSISDDGKLRVKKSYRRIPRESSFELPLPTPEERRRKVAVPNSNNLVLVVIARPVRGIPVDSGRIPAGTRSVSVFLVNERTDEPALGAAYKAIAFQTCLKLTCNNCFVPRPDLRGAVQSSAIDDWDLRVADLQYRNAYEFAVGHGVSARHELCEDGSCMTVSTAWLPQGEVERVVPSQIPDVELGMEALAALTDAEDAKAKLMPLVNQYREWIEVQRGKFDELNVDRRQVAAELMGDAEQVANRIEAGIKLLSDDKVLESFRLANKTMARAARQRSSLRYGGDITKTSSPTWRPFQLAFILMSMRGIVEPEHSDRDIVDLLFFPTGGGKTEAYLGLAAFTMVLRRLRNPGITSAGLCVLMRYTLRLLTLDQLGRASTLICALELEREKNPEFLGKWPFEIGLWVGQAATPNRMGRKGDTGPGKEFTAYTKTRHFRSDPQHKPSPIPLENCPWCDSKFSPDSFRLEPNQENPIDLRVRCSNIDCDFSGDRALPLVTVDEPVYRRLPAFMIATVDKFAALPWTAIACLFGKVSKHDRNGFYDINSGAGQMIPGGSLLPPELIIQDELHLISGPLGTIAGLYEVAIDELATRRVGDNKAIRPKIIASTATVRKADSQIRALFGRQRVVIFPTPGPDRRDSFFARTDPPESSPPRLYVGVSAQGRSPKVILLRVALALLSAAQRLYEREGGKRNKNNPVDPYMTLLEYFNSLRELGGSRRIMEDEVRTRLAEYATRRRLDPVDNLFADRQIRYEVVELTSRVSTNKVAEAKQRLGLSFAEDKPVDIALATNMISVGLDITRLGLMSVFGQPKTTAEYIQTTSRVGRDQHKPGLVVTILNIHKPRDRSHYERFAMFHSTFYRGVEATSVTPFSPRALDRALPGALVGLVRNGDPRMTPATGATQILDIFAELDQFALRFAERGRDHRGGSDSEQIYNDVLNRCRNLLDGWSNIARDAHDKSTKLQYQDEEGGGKRRLIYEYLHQDVKKLTPLEKKFRANRSMRDVEPNVDLHVKQLNEWGNR